MASSSSVMVHETDADGASAARAGGGGASAPGASAPGAPGPGMSAALERLATTVADLAAAVESIRTLSTAGEGGAESVAPDAEGPPAQRNGRARARHPASSGSPLDRPQDAAGAGSGPFGVDGVRRLLAAVAPEDELERFHRATLGPLLDEDARQHGELSRTLEAYIECGGNTVQAAKRVCAHRNTVLYRLERLRELLGVDLRDPHARFVLQLALHAGAATRHAGGPPPARREAGQPPQ